MPNTQLVPAPACTRGSARPTATVRRTASSSWAVSTPAGGHSSNAIAMSDPRRRWIAHRQLGREAVLRAVVRASGSRRPSSSIVAVSRSEKTWYPPESVRMARSHPMNRCRPPSRRSAPRPAGSRGGRCSRARSGRPGRAAPRASRAFTVACVPTGMKTGVSTGPWAVWSTPARAAPSVAAMSNCPVTRSASRRQTSRTGSARPPRCCRGGAPRRYRRTPSPWRAASSAAGGSWSPSRRSLRIRTRA